MEKELRVEGTFYLTMKKNETEEEAVDRFYALMDQADICVSAPYFEEQDV